MSSQRLGLGRASRGRLVPRDLSRRRRLDHPLRPAGGRAGAAASRARARRAVALLRRRAGRAAHHRRRRASRGDARARGAGRGGAARRVAGDARGRRRGLVRLHGGARVRLRRVGDAGARRAVAALPPTLHADRVGADARVRLPPHRRAVAVLASAHRRRARRRRRRADRRTAGTGAAAGKLDKPPRLLRFVEAEPPAALAERSSVSVILTIDIDDAGKVVKVDVAQLRRPGVRRRRRRRPRGSSCSRPARPAASRCRCASPTSTTSSTSRRRRRRHRRRARPPAVRRPCRSSGRVLRAGDRAPLAGRHRHRRRWRASPPSTNADGRFQLSTSPLGPHVLHVVGPEIAKSDFKVTLNAGKSLHDRPGTCSARERYTLDGARPARRRRDRRADALRRRAAPHPRHAGRHAQGGAEPARRGARAVRRRPARRVGLGAATTRAPTSTASTSPRCTTSAACARR